MPGKSHLYSSAVLNVLNGNDLPGVMPFVALFSLAPGDDGSVGTELIGSGHSRQAITFGAPGPAAGNAQQAANTSNIQFGGEENERENQSSNDPQVGRKRRADQRGDASRSVCYAQRVARRGVWAPDAGVDRHLSVRAGLNWPIRVAMNRTDHRIDRSARGLAD